MDAGDAAGGAAPAVGDPCLLAMRGCAAHAAGDGVGGGGERAGDGDGAGASGDAAGAGGPWERRDRLATFRPRPGARTIEDAPPITARVRHAGLELSRYEDGGRLLRASGDRRAAPGTGETGLLTMASSRIGDTTGRLACDPYRSWPAAGPRNLVLLVDTSGSIVATKRVPGVIVCAAGAALAGLDRGHPVTVVNFSSETWFYQTSSDAQVIHDALSRIQGGTTLLPRLGLLPIRGSEPRDFVLITDAAIHNLKDVLPDYARAIRRGAPSRAQLYALGLEDQGGVAVLERAGFRTTHVEREGADFRRFAVDTLRRLAPAPLRWTRWP